MLVRCLAFAAVALGALATSTQDPPTASASNANLRQVSGLRLRVGDSIDDLDFVVSDDGALTLVWLVSLYDDPNDHSRVKSEVWASQREREGSAWTNPALIASKVTGPLRILESQNRLHVLVGRKLRHFASNDRGRTWSEYQQLGQGPEAQSFDAAVDGNSLVVAYLASLPRLARARHPDSVAVWTTKWSERAGAGARVRVGTFPGSRFFQPEPKLLRVGSDLLMFVAVNGKTQTAASGADPEDARVFQSRSKDHGATWSQPQRLATLGLRNGQSREDGSGYVSHLDAAHHGAALLVLYNAHALYGLRSADGRAWSTPSPVALDKGWLGPASTSSVSVAAWGTGGWLLWIDERFRRTDRTPSNPWGFPWFLDPDWSNNDVLALPMRKILDDRAGGSQAQPSRITDDLSYATRVRVRAGGGRAFAIWAGREKVGKDLHSYGKPPTIFCLTLVSQDQQ